MKNISKIATLSLLMGLSFSLFASEAPETDIQLLVRKTEKYIDITSDIKTVKTQNNPPDDPAPLSQQSSPNDQYITSLARLQQKADDKMWSILVEKCPATVDPGCSAVKKLLLAFSAKIESSPKAGRDNLISITKLQAGEAILTTFEKKHKLEAIEQEILDLENQ